MEGEEVKDEESLRGVWSGVRFAAGGEPELVLWPELPEVFGREGLCAIARHPKTEGTMEMVGPAYPSERPGPDEGNNNHAESST